MEKEKQILLEVKKTLSSFDNDIILEENPFLLTRLKTEIESRANQRKHKLVFGIGWKQALLLLVILINAITLAYNFEKKADQNLTENLIIELKEDLLIDQSEEDF